jgi:histidyl-tRNA synthetase
MSDPQALSAAITEQTQRLNELRLSTVQDPAAIDEAKKNLSQLKKTLGELKREGAGLKDAKKRERLLLKTAKASLAILVSNPRSNREGT